MWAVWTDTLMNISREQQMDRCQLPAWLLIPQLDRRGLVMICICKIFSLKHYSPCPESPWNSLRCWPRMPSFQETVSSLVKFVFHTLMHSQDKLACSVSAACLLKIPSVTRVQDRCVHGNAEPSCCILIKDCLTHWLCRCCPQVGSRWDMGQTKTSQLSIISHHITMMPGTMHTEHRPYIK